MDLSVILLLLLALALGAAIGWLVGSRAAASSKEVIANLRLQLDAVVEERDANRSAANELAGLRAAQEERERSFQQQIEALREAKESLSAQFHEIGGKLLGEARKAFLEQAGEKFTQAVTPVEALLKSYQEKLQSVEKERVDHYAGLREAVELVRAGQGQVRDETRNLVNALRSSPKARGRWGEQSLRNVLEHAGLSEYADFRTEVSVDGEDGKLRPDVVVRLPGGRQLIIDAKCSLNAYLDACDEIDEDKRAACFRAHVASIRNHAQQLGSKTYWAQFDDSAELVVMYVPGEHFLNAALELDPTLWEWAYERKVLLATPTNLVVVARTAAYYWEQSGRNEAAEEIARLAKELHSRLATMAEHMARMGKNLATANTAYNQMVGSFESQVLTQARRFENLGAGSAKPLDAPPMVEASPRPLTKVAPPASANEDDAAA
ncbi:MAG TPA: DNA recombination protein RmuC [Sphingomicrobium sp.]|nr:DNA recombination protein RmuC [Sphingomicrobium sp.]